MEYFAVAQTPEIKITIIPSNGAWDNAQEIINKICEANKERTLRIEVKHVSC